MSRFIIWSTLSITIALLITTHSLYPTSTPSKPSHLPSKRKKLTNPKYPSTTHHTISIQKTPRKNKQYQITEDDREYFLSSIIDYLCDFEDFSNMLDTLPQPKVLQLYQIIQEHLANFLWKSRHKTFPTLQEKNDWILNYIHKLKRKILSNPKLYLYSKNSNL